MPNRRRCSPDDDSSSDPLLCDRPRASTVEICFAPQAKRMRNGVAVRHFRDEPSSPLCNFGNQIPALLKMSARHNGPSLPAWDWCSTAKHLSCQQPFRPAPGASCAAISAERSSLRLDRSYHGGLYRFGRLTDGLAASPRSDAARTKLIPRTAKTICYE
jgi:hypothetical protein